MTFKIVGALTRYFDPRPSVMTALKLGIAIGLFMDLARKLIKRMPSYKEFATKSGFGKTVDFLIDAVLLPSPVRLSFGGFVEIATVYWWTAGGIVGSLYETAEKKVGHSDEKYRGRIASRYGHDVARWGWFDRG